MKAAKFVLHTFLALLNFVLLVFGEGAIRSTQIHPLPIDDPSIPGTTIHGSWKPDFLWAGKAWGIKINTQAPFVLKLNHNWIGSIPVGKHTIYGNHDPKKENGMAIWA